MEPKWNQGRRQSTAVDVVYLHAKTGTLPESGGIIAGDA